MRPLQRVMVGVLGIVITIAVLAAVRPADRPRPSAGPGTPPPDASGTAPPFGSAQTIAGPAYGPGENDPTRSTAQSKIWYADGRWWAILWSATTGESRVHVLDTVGAAWQDTGVIVDARPGARADVLADDDRIVVASGGLNAESPRDGIRLTALRYDTERETYEPEPDYPIQLTDHGVESIVLARDVDGRLWAAYVHLGQLLVDRTDGDDHRWLGPISLDVAAATRNATIASLSDRMVVVSTGTTADTLDVWLHRTGDPDETWTSTRHEVRGLRGTTTPLVARAAVDRLGEAVHVVARTTLDRTDVNALAPLVLLFRVGPDGDIRSSVFGRVVDRHHEPTLAIDEAAGRIYVIASVTIGDSRTLVYKAAALADPVFESGVGTLLVASDADRSVAGPTTPSRPIDAATGLVVMAADDAIDRYVSGALDVPRRTPPAPAAERVLVRDRFDSWPDGTPIGGLWRIDLDGEDSGATVEEGAGSDGGALTLVADPAGNGQRACRSFQPVTGGTVAAAVDVWLEAFGSTDGGIWLRGDGEQGPSMRFEDTGVLSAYGGAEKIRSTVRYATGTWYRVAFEAAVGERTYDWRIVERDGGRIVLEASGLAWRSELATLVDEICIDAASGVPGANVRIDSVEISSR